MLHYLCQVIEGVIKLIDNRLQFSVPGETVDTGTLSNNSAGEESEATPFTETERLARDRKNIIAALHLTSGKISGEDGAAELLGIKPTTLASRIRSLGVEKMK